MSRTRTRAREPKRAQKVSGTDVVDAAEALRSLADNVSDDGGAGPSGLGARGAEGPLPPGAFGLPIVDDGAPPRAVRGAATDAVERARARALSSWTPDRTGSLTSARDIVGGPSAGPVAAS